MSCVPVPIEYGKPIFEFDQDCRRCRLGKGQALCGSIHANLDNVKLMVISDYPGTYEMQNRYCMFDNQPLREEKERLYQGYPNAGNFLRRILESWGLDTYAEVYFTNVVKCQIGKNKPTESKEIRTCVEQWLLLELDLVHQANPVCPILIAGGTAYKGFRLLTDSPFKLDGTNKLALKNARRKVHFYNTHPVVVSVNPAAASNSLFKIETNYIGNKRDIRNIRELPTLTGSPKWHYLKDLEPLKSYVQLSPEQ